MEKITTLALFTPAGGDSLLNATPVLKSTQSTIRASATLCSFVGFVIVALSWWAARISGGILGQWDTLWPGSWQKWHVMTTCKVKFHFRPGVNHGEINPWKLLWPEWPLQTIIHIQRSAKVGATGLVNFITAVAYHFSLYLPAAFTKPGASTFANPRRKWWMELGAIFGNALTTLASRGITQPSLTKNHITGYVITKPGHVEWWPFRISI